MNTEQKYFYCIRRFVRSWNREGFMHEGWKRAVEKYRLALVEERKAKRMAA